MGIHSLRLYFVYLMHLVVLFMDLPYGGWCCIRPLVNSVHMKYELYIRDLNLKPGYLNVLARSKFVIYQ